eukprot:TRINITY_DN31_c0_g1_i7.p1 TRINITY_DN31_c0_g1~~TRINITY_DN31_c0_g1_i7.p1  ORF type:complete len:449 (+),score=176.60 TRINITY_DN31_c0_g1_i7:82-1428(+)
MPKKIGKYELGKTLGTGTFSKVKLGIDTDENSQWAIKIIDKAQLAKEHMEEQLKREIAVMKLLKHQNIVQLREVLQTQKHIYLILEIITGGELFDRIVAAKKFDEKTARRYFQQLVCGVGYCHAQGIAHRDLKPENLLLDSQDVLKISDFGLSNLQRGPAGGGGTLLQTVCGTPNYVAPEVLKERGYNGITADIWSCGVILFVMLAGYLPFDDPNMNALFNKIERGEYRMARHFTDPVKDIISRMLVIEPEKRITLEQIMQHPWFRIDLDESMFRQGDKVSVSKQQVDGAVSSVGEQTGQTDRSAPKASAGIDAFDLMARVTQGNLDPLTSGGAGSTIQVNRQTRTVIAVRSGVSPRDAVKSVLCCDALKGNPKDGKDPVEIKGFCNASKGLMTYVCTVCPFIPVKGQQWCFVEMRRGRGDTLDFQSFWEAFNGLLAKGEGGCEQLVR